MPVGMYADSHLRQVFASHSGPFLLDIFAYLLGGCKLVVELHKHLTFRLVGHTVSVHQPTYINIADGRFLGKPVQPMRLGSLETQLHGHLSEMSDNHEEE